MKTRIAMQGVELGFLSVVTVRNANPTLAVVPKAKVRAALGVSEPYSADIQSGKRVPHPRHWEKLKELAGTLRNMSN